MPCSPPTLIFTSGSPHDKWPPGSLYRFRLRRIRGYSSAEAVPPEGTVIGDHKLEIDPVMKFGYLTVTTDAKTMTITFKTAPGARP